MQPIKKTILYAEDDAVTSTAYKGRLEQAGYKVETAADGLEALKKLHNSPPDLLLLDLLLPKFTGEEVLKFVTVHPSLSRIPVILLSTNSILTAANETLLQRAERHFLKHNCPSPKLIEAIKEILADEKVAARTRANHAEAEQDRKSGTSAKDLLIDEIKDLQGRTQLVCAWTDRINIEGKWLKLTEFLSQHLHLNVTHGLSPEGMQQFLKGATDKG